MKKIMRSLLLMLIVMVIASTAFSEVGDTLQVKVKSFPPCVVIEDDGTITGFDIAIWKEICFLNGWECEYSVDTTHKNILEKLGNKDIDVGIAGFTITEDRENFVDFSHHYLDSGLRILTLKSDTGILDKIISFWNNIKNTLIYYSVFLIIFAHIVWIFERDDDPTNNIGSFSDKYYPGIFEAIYYCIITASTVGFGDYVCKKLKGRFFTIVLVISGIIAFCNFTAVLSSSYTIDNISSIKSVDDLKGKTILTQEGPSLKLLESLGANVKVVPTVEQSVDWLMLGRGDAVVYDSPVILEYAKKYPDKVEVVGSLFDKQYYGFALQEGSPLRQNINKALLQLRENGKYNRIYSEWFQKD